MFRTSAFALVAFLALTGPQTSAAQEDAQPAAPSAMPMWLISCSNQVNVDELLCEFSQSIVLTNQAGQSQRVATASFQRVVGATGIEAVFSLPFEVSLQDDVALLVDDAPLGSLAWQSCDAGGCYATGPVEESWMQAMRAGAQLGTALKARDGRDITFSFNLDGFSRAADMLP